tara:strand:- start:293 stop:883 length:591 start_codon:yes stop_codon:yes gene_type:complete
MKALGDFIIQPLNGRYKNSIDVDGKNLILNTEIFNHQYVNREAEILAVPSAYETEFQVGDIVIVHHNVFRRWTNVRGEEKNSRSYYKEDKYFVKPDQIFLYKRDKEWIAPKGCCFVKPIHQIDQFSIDKERPLIGIIKHVDVNLEGINKDDLVGFTPYSEYEFIIDGERLYRVWSQDISIKYEYQGDEEEYNPSWS